MERTNRPSLFKLGDKALEAEAKKIEAAGGGKPAIADGGGSTIAPPQRTEPPAPTATQTTIPPEKNNTTVFAPGSKPAAEIPTTTKAPVQEGPKESDDERDLRILRERTGNPDLTFEDFQTMVNPKKVLTPEEQKIQDQLSEQELLKQFISSGKGTMDDFHRIRTLKDMKDLDLVKDRFRIDAKKQDPSLTDGEIDEYFAAQYFVGDKDTFSEKQIRLGEKRLKEDAARIRSFEAEPLNLIEKDLKLNQEAIEARGDWDRTVDKFVSTTLPKSIKIPIGKIGEVEVGDFNYNLSEDEQRDVAKKLKDPAYLVNQIRDKTGKTDLTKLANLVINQQVMDRAIKAAAGEYYSKGVESIGGKLNNYPDLGHTGNTSTSDEAKAKLEGEAILKKDADQVFGRKNRRKALPS